jgi:hypothetical protein
MLWQKICIQNFGGSTCNLGDSSLSGDISLSPTKGEGPLVRASSPTIITILISSGLLFILITQGRKKNYGIRLSIVYLLAIRIILFAVS